MTYITNPHNIANRLLEMVMDGAVTWGSDIGTLTDAATILKSLLPDREGKLADIAHRIAYGHVSLWEMDGGGHPVRELGDSDHMAVVNAIRIATVSRGGEP